MSMPAFRPTPLAPITLISQLITRVRGYLPLEGREDEPIRRHLVRGSGLLSLGRQASAERGRV